MSGHFEPSFFDEKALSNLVGLFSRAGVAITKADDRLLAWMNSRGLSPLLFRGHWEPAGGIEEGFVVRKPTKMTAEEFRARMIEAIESCELEGLLFGDGSGHFAIMRPDGTELALGRVESAAGEGRMYARLRDNSRQFMFIGVACPINSSMRWIPSRRLFASTQ